LTIEIAVIAHPRRKQEAQRLASMVEALSIFWDTESMGCETNHRVAWEMMAKLSEADWLVFLEDDIEVVPDFRRQLDEILAVAPSPLVSLYLGRGRPPHWQPAIAEAITSVPSPDTCWLMAPALFSAQGYAIRTDILPTLITAPRTTLPIDEHISSWASARNIPVAYCWPSIVEHRDDLTPLIQERADGQPRIEQRVAWKFGTRPTWGTQVHQIKTPQQLGMRVIPA
jgi:GR25 family glycosyltransferase involved in LPS biosynthesis